MSNSKLVSYTQISPNKTSPRNHAIDTVTIHCYVGQVTLERMGNGFADPSRNASCNYGISHDGKVGMFCEEKDRSWCSSSSSNDNRAITIEVACDATHPYTVNDVAYATLLDLLTDICKRNNIKKLLWKADKSLVGQVNKQNMTVHRWFANKACPGDYLYSKHSEIAAAVNKRLEALNTKVKNPYKQPSRTIYKTFPTQKGEDVKWVQFELNRHLSAKLEVDGKCGSLTSTAIKSYQRKVGLVVDGKCGPATRKALLK